MSLARSLTHIVFAIMFVLPLMSAAAQAQTSRLYFAGYMGLNMPSEQGFSDSGTGLTGDVKFDNAPAFAGALGLRLMKDVRIEAEVSYRNPDISSFDIDGFGTLNEQGNLKNWLGLLNVYYDFDLRGKIKPYIGAGLGFGHYTAEFDGESDDTTAFSYQVGAGLKYQLSPKTAITGGYRYLDSLDLDFDGMEVDYGSHELMIGLQYDLDWR